MSGIKANVSVIVPIFAHVTPHPGESLMSLVARTAERNIIERIVNLTGDVAGAGINTGFIPFSREIDPALLARRLSLQAVEVRTRMHGGVPAGGLGACVDFFGSPLERRLIEAKKRRVAPRSLASSLHHRGIWTVRALSFCPESFEHLIDHCSECARPLGWTRTLGPWRCEWCGFRLWRSQTSFTPTCLRSELRMASAWVSEDPNKRARGCAQMPTQFDGFTGGELMSAAVTLGVARARFDPSLGRLDPGRVGKGTFQKFNEQHLAAGVEMLLDWPRSIHRFFEEVIPSMSVDPTLHKTLDAIGLPLRISRTRFHDILRSEVGGFIRDVLPAAKVIPTSRLLASSRRSQMTMREAVRVCGVSAKVLRRLVGEGESFVTRGRRAGVVVFDEELLKRSCEIYKSAVIASVIVKMTGIPRCSLNHLGSMGLLRVVSDKDAITLAQGQVLFEANSVDRLCDRIRGNAAMVPESTEHILNELSGCLDVAIWGHVVKALFEGTIRFELDECDGRNLLESIKVFPRELANSILGVENPEVEKEMELSCREAEQLTGISDVIYALSIKTGLLVGRRDSRSYKVRLDDLRKFRSEYLVGTEISLPGNVTPSQAVDFLRSRGKSPVAVLHKYNIWRRSDVGLMQAAAQAR